MIAGNQNHQESRRTWPRPVRRILYLLGVAAFSVIGAIPSPVAHARTRLRDLHASWQGDRARVVCLLDARPSFSLTPEGPKQVLVTLLNTTAAERIDRRTPEGGRMHLESSREGDRVILRMGSERPIREIRASWLPDEELLCFEFLEAVFSRASLPETLPATLRHIRFGEKPGGIRVVTEYTGRPQWEWTLRDAHRALLRARGSETYLQPGALPAGRGVTSARLEKTNGGAEVELTLLQPSRAANIFWLEAGSRLVADFWEENPDPDLKALDLPRDFGVDPVQAGRVEPKGLLPLQAGGDRGGDPPKEARGSNAEKALSHIVKMKVPTENRQKPEKSPGEAGPISNTAQAPAAPPPGVESTSETRKSGSEDRQWDLGSLKPEEALLYGRILEARNFRDYERGSVLIAEFSERFPESPLAEAVSFLKGDLEFYLVESGRKELLSQMESTYRAAIDRFPGSKEAPRAYLRLAEAHGLMGNDYQAIGYLNIFISRYPGSEMLPQAYLQRGNVHLQGASPEKALEDYKSLLKAHPSSPLAQEARYGIIVYLHKKKLYEEAEKWFMEMDQLNPNFYRGHPEYLSLRAQNHLYLKEYVEARRLFFKAVNVGDQPETSDLLLTRIGDTYLHEGKEREAQRYYRLVVDDFPGSEGSSISQLRLADFTSGTEAIEQVRDQNVDRPVGELAVLKMANVYFENQKYPEAMESLKKLVSVPPQNEVRAAARQLYYKAAKKELVRLHSEERLEDFVRLLNDNEALLFGMVEPDLRLLEGKTLLRLKRHDEAVRAFEKIQPADLNPEDRGIRYLGLADGYKASGDTERAIRITEEGRKAPVDEKARHRLTLMLAELRMGEDDLKASLHLYQEAVRDQTLLSLDEMARGYYQMGRILNRQGSHEKAREVLNRAVALAERDRGQGVLRGLIHAEIGESYFGQRRPADAAKSYLEALQGGYGPEEAGYWAIKFRLAECHLDLGEAQPAEAIFREISEEGDPELQSRVQIRLGALGLERQLRRLSIWDKEGTATAAHVEQ